MQLTYRIILQIQARFEHYFFLFVKLGLADTAGCLLDAAGRGRVATLSSSSCESPSLELDDSIGEIGRRIGIRGGRGGSEPGSVEL